MSEFVEYLKEVFASFGEIRTRRMFGGHGVYHNDLMFGLIADNILYLKTDKESLHLFEHKGLSPFQYVKNGKSMNMSYSVAPEEIFDDPDVAKEWATIAYAAAVRNRKPNKKKRRK